MGTMMLACGCAVSKSMYGNRDVMAVYHCPDHQYLYSPDKTANQMAAEIGAIVRAGMEKNEQA